MAINRSHQPYKGAYFLGRRMIRRLFFELKYLLGKPPWDTGISPPELIEFLDSHPPGRALDLGCGTGTNAITMAQYGWGVHGIDISAYAIRKAHRKATSSGVKVNFIQGSASELKGVEGFFDLILDIGCFHAITVESKKEYAQKVQKHLAPSGYFLLYTSLHQEIDGDDFQTPEDRLLTLFSSCCKCINIVRSSDWASHRLSAWFTFRKIL